MTPSPSARAPPAPSARDNCVECAGSVKTKLTTMYTFGELCWPLLQRRNALCWSFGIKIYSSQLFVCFTSGWLIWVRFVQVILNLGEDYFSNGLSALCCSLCLAVGFWNEEAKISGYSNPERSDSPTPKDLRVSTTGLLLTGIIFLS